MGSGGSEAGVGGDSQRERGRQRQRQRLMRRGGGQGGRWGRGGGWGRTRGDWASTVAWWSGDSGVGREVSKAHEAPGGGGGRLDQNGVETDDRSIRNQHPSLSRRVQTDECKLIIERRSRYE